MSHIQNFWIRKNLINSEISPLCCGCSVCANKCPVNAISMKYDSEGFLYPWVDEKKCIDCGVCLQTCPIINQSDYVAPYIRTYAGYSLDKDILMNCTSGGFVTTLSLMIIERGGIVAGVRYSSDFVKSYYCIARTKEEVLSLSGSKYVQSEKMDVYIEVEKELKRNTMVLFVGCPCEIQAITLYLGTIYSTFLSCELVCMGVSSYKIAKDYKKYVEKRNKAKLIRINARSKMKGWFVPHLEEEFDNGQIRCNTLFGTFLGYGMQVYNRPSCFQCKFRGMNGTGDIRVGDFWGIKETDPYWNPAGVSCIFVRTQKGLDVVNTLKNYGFALYEVDYETATLSNISSHSNKAHKYVELRKKFAFIYEKKGLIAACRATGTISFWIKHCVPDCWHVGMKKLYHKFVDKR